MDNDMSLCFICGQIWMVGFAITKDYLFLFCVAMYMTLYGLYFYNYVKRGRVVDDGKK